MKILLINTSDRIGGAAVACYRLLKALQQNNVSTKMLVQEEISNDSDVTSTTHSKVKYYYNFIQFAWERLIFTLNESSRAVRFAFSLANTGEDISKSEIVQISNILHLHWINNGFLSLNGLTKLFEMNKPVVWTLHDMWPFTGGCHYAGDCKNYETECRNCPFLKHPSDNDLSNRIFHAKLRLMKQVDPTKITFVACSQWLAEVAKTSRLLNGFKIVAIPNPIDTTRYYPIDKIIARNRVGLPLNKKLILFGAGNIFDKRKGIQYLREALTILSKQHPEYSNQIELVVFGKSKQNTEDLFSFKVHNYGILNNEDVIINLYNSADMFILPSLEDNLPNTIMESMACGTPVVAFRTGGIPEMIEHLKNGFLSDYRSASSLADGINHLLFSDSSKNIRVYARSKIEMDYAPNVIANRYKNIYESLFTSSTENKS